jgi:hypothetical protein
MVKRLKETLPDWGYKVIAFIAMVTCVIGAPLTIWGLTILIDVSGKLSKLDGVPEKVQKHEVQISIINDRLKITGAQNGLFKKTLGMAHYYPFVRFTDNLDFQTASRIRYKNRQHGNEYRRWEVEPGGLRSNRQAFGGKEVYPADNGFTICNRGDNVLNTAQLDSFIQLYSHAFFKICNKRQE